MEQEQEMRLTKEQKEDIEAKVEDTFANEHNSKEFIRACVWEHYEREILR